MTTDDNLAARRLIETGAIVPFRVAAEDVQVGPDKAELGFRIDLVFEGEEDEDPTDVVAWGAIGFIFVVAAISFQDARPRGASELEYEECDMLRASDFLEGLRFERGVLEYDGDYVRGRRMKTRIAVRPEGTATVETRGRGKAPARWLARLRGEGFLRAVLGDAGDV
jgi:hypothetical protein